jgi:asparagine synthase (glutamine-hydrolysing)
VSAILGMFYRDGKVVDATDLSRMLSSLSHRGQDGRNSWCRGSIGLGHILLRSTPEASGTTVPLVRNDNSLALTADVRLDNRAELIDKLNLTARPQAEISDAELILAAYERWGAACPRHLLGDFAFAVWDGRKQSLFCARDHFGVKPFYYYLGDEVFVFASEIKAILCVPGVPRRINELQIGYFLTGTFEDTAITFFDGILRLPPAHSLTVRVDGQRLEHYWSADPQRELRLGSDADYAEAFAEHFYNAVRVRLRTHDRVGSMLSGGLDSSSVACVARAILGETTQTDLHTFSAVFEQVSASNEQRFIDAVLAQGGTRPQFFAGDQSSPLDAIEEVNWYGDEPLTAFNLYLNRGLYAIAREQNVRVMLDGFDGDTTVSHGTGYFHELARANRWPALYRELRGFAANFGGDPTHLWRTYLWRYRVKPWFNRIPLLHQAYAAVRRVGNGRNSAAAAGATSVNSLSALREDFAHKIELRERMRSLRKRTAGFPRNERESHYRVLTQGVLPHILEVLNKAATPFGIDLRFPFWDRHLVEFCLALPAEQKLQQGWSRLVLRRGMEGYLPPSVQWRSSKSNLGHSFEYSLRKFESARIGAVISNYADTLGQYFDLGSLNGSHQRFAHGTSSSGDEMLLFRAVSLALWLQSLEPEPQDGIGIKEVITQVSDKVMP